MHPTNLDSGPTTPSSGDPAQHFNRLGISTGDFSDADSSTTIEAPGISSVTSFSASKKDKRKGRRGGKSKKTVASSTSTGDDEDMDGPLDRNYPYLDLLSPGVIRRLLTLGYLSDVPVLALYELRSSSRLASEDNPDGEGLFAKQAIPEGTRIICEPPLISLPAPGNDIEAIYAAFQQLTLEEQQAIWSLRPKAPMHLHDLSLLIDTMIPHVLALHEKTEAGRTEEESRTYEILAPRVEIMCRVWRIAARFYAHQYSLTTVAEADRNSIPPDEHVTGLFVTPARLRHSCVPNVHCTYNPRTNRMTVHATKHIPAHTELTVSYIGHHAFYLTAAERRTKLLETANLVCNCEACDVTHPKFPAHQLLRARLHTNTAWLGTFLTNLDIHENPHQHPSSFADPGYPNQEKLTAAEMKLIETIKMLEKAGCKDLEIVRWRLALYKNLLPRRGQWIAALAQARLARDRALICWGADHLEVEELEKGVEHVEEILKGETKKKMERKRKDMEAERKGKRI